MGNDVPKFFEAVRSETKTTISTYLKSGMQANVKDETGKTALHILCENDRPNFQIINMFLTMGGDLNMKYPDGKVRKKKNRLIFQKIKKGNGKRERRNNKINKSNT